ncbi:hydroxymethylpyrimidine/phosphomethylpyrimidine kinase [Aquimarina sp. AU474]|uniref:hydroxymethylpyrimidine/phosphomethylpyrimidine kinase n=1 Tax=Aquimarina sp. AU474 TaxID=2108529 RepID=UPI000D6948CB|nr:hydroxymethylpyrimidine/phosphomethylpyrimidine kinase [Aquimarina sp. AU474]
MKQRPYTLTIAGFDPSNGAGITADVKTFEASKVYGLSVCTANTVQNDIEFTSCHWVDIEVIKSQIDALFDRFNIGFVKIGIVENWNVLIEIIDVLLEKNSKLKIIWDPILRSSSEFDFYDISSQEVSINQFDSILDKIYLLTPNYHEIKALCQSKTILETVKHISSKTNLLLKGGHRKENIGKDELFMQNGKHFVLNPKRSDCSEKHGSGCILSSAITAQLALGSSLVKSCYRGKKYTEKVLSSNKILLGYHKI